MKNPSTYEESSQQFSQVRFFQRAPSLPYHLSCHSHLQHHLFRILALNLGLCSVTSIHRLSVENVVILTKRNVKMPPQSIELGTKRRHKYACLTLQEFCPNYSG